MTDQPKCGLGAKSIVRLLYTKSRNLVPQSKQKVKVVEVRTGLVTWTEQCTNVRVNINRGGSWCRQCYRKQEGAVDENGKLLDKAQKKKNCKTSRMGCPQRGCKEHICKDCWAEGYDRHQKN